MHNNLAAYAHTLKAKGLHQDEIVKILTEAGWDHIDALSAVRDEALPRPPLAPRGAHVDHEKNARVLSQDRESREPIAVVQNLSVRGFEYSIMFLTLWISAVSIGLLAHNYVTDMFDKSTGDYYYGDGNPVNSFAVTMLIIAFPIFVFMFLRLKKAELHDPVLRNDPSRHKLLQLTQLVSFIMGIGYLAYFLYSVINPSRYDDSFNITKSFLHMLITLTIAGGIFVYYWRDSHKDAVR